MLKVNDYAISENKYDYAILKDKYAIIEKYVMPKLNMDNYRVTFRRGFDV